MNQLIGLLLPSIIGLKSCDKHFGETKDKKILIERYLICVLFTNLILYSIVIYILKQPNFIFTNQFTFKYLGLSTIIAYILPIIWRFLSNIITIDIKVKKNEK